MRVPFVSLDRQYRTLRRELMTEFDRVGLSGMYIMGEMLSRFETEIAAFCGSRYALGVANGSDALFLALKALGIGPGDEVITCPNSFIATTWTIVAAGARPVFVDVCDDYNIDVSQIERVVNSRTRAIVPVHLAGRPADMDAINTIAARHDLAVIEDAAQAVGARYKGRRVGALGTVAGFSLHPLKNLSVLGDGGFVTTDNAQIHEKISLLRNHGLRNRDECKLWGYNSRLDSMQAAFALVKLGHLERWNERCRDIAAYYRASLRDYVRVPEDREYEENVYHNFMIRLERRDELVRFMAERGVDTRVHYPIPIHLQEAARALGYKRGDFPVTERHAQTMLSLPIYPELEQSEVEWVVHCIKEFFGK